MPDQAREVITITHPDIEVAATCTRKQFVRLYEPRGWSEDGDTDKVLATSTRTQPPPKFSRALRGKAATWPPPLNRAGASKAASKPDDKGGN